MDQGALEEEKVSDVALIRPEYSGNLASKALAQKDFLLRWIVLRAFDAELPLKSPRNTAHVQNHLINYHLSQGSMLTFAQKRTRICFS